MTKLTRDLEQFQDPWGLFRRMASSGDRTARWLLMQKAVSVLASPVDRLLSLSERRGGREPVSTDLPLVFIVGPPRTGTTLLYQLLVHCLDVSYFDNVDALFPRAPVTGRRLLRRPDRADRFGFSSYYGNTAGWYAPNDAFQVWNRWLGGHRYRARQELSEAAAEDMRRFFARWLSATGKPLLNKNNRNADCVPLLADALGNSVFVEVSREHEFVVQSLLMARETVQGRVERGWGLDSEQLEPGAPREMVIDAVCAQLDRIQEKLDHAAAAAGNRRYLRIKYEDVCSDPGGTVEAVAAFVPEVTFRSGVDPRAIGPFRGRNVMTLPQSEVDYIRQRLAAVK